MKRTDRTIITPTSITLRLAVPTTDLVALDRAHEVAETLAFRAGRTVLSLMDAAKTLDGHGKVVRMELA